jgi:hypothetical protein
VHSAGAPNDVERSRPNLISLSQVEFGVQTQTPRASCDLVNLFVAHHGWSVADPWFEVPRPMGVFAVDGIVVTQVIVDISEPILRAAIVRKWRQHAGGSRAILEQPLGRIARGNPTHHAATRDRQAQRTGRQVDSGRDQGVEGVEQAVAIAIFAAAQSHRGWHSEGSSSWRT